MVRRTARTAQACVVRGVGVTGIRPRPRCLTCLPARRMTAPLASASGAEPRPTTTGSQSGSWPGCRPTVPAGHQRWAPGERTPNPRIKREPWGGSHRRFQHQQFQPCAHKHHRTRWSPLVRTTNDSTPAVEVQRERSCASDQDRSVEEMHAAPTAFKRPGPPLGRVGEVATDEVARERADRGCSACRARGQPRGCRLP